MNFYEQTKEKIDWLSELLELSEAQKGLLSKTIFEIAHEEYIAGNRAGSEWMYNRMTKI